MKFITTSTTALTLTALLVSTPVTTAFALDTPPPAEPAVVEETTVEPEGAEEVVQDAVESPELTVTFAQEPSVIEGPRGAEVVFPESEGVSYTLTNSLSSARHGEISYTFFVTATPLDGFIFENGETEIFFTLEGSYPSEAMLTPIPRPSAPSVHGFTQDDIEFPQEELDFTWKLVEHSTDYTPTGMKYSLFRIDAVADEGYIFETGQKTHTWWLTYEPSEIRIAHPDIRFESDSITPEGLLTASAYLQLDASNPGVSYEVIGEGWEPTGVPGEWKSTKTRDFRLGVNFNDFAVYVKSPQGSVVVGDADLIVDQETGYIKMPFLLERYFAAVCPADERGPLRLPNDGVSDCSVETPPVTEEPTVEEPEDKTPPTTEEPTVEEPDKGITKVPSGPSIDDDDYGVTRKWTFDTPSPEEHPSTAERLVQTGSDSYISFLAASGLLSLFGGGLLLTRILRREEGAGE
ncbi:hypothetical protein ICM05_05325 [Leucobacter sp. cx-42]|uniref:hypothetical protein n=1 Tax=unclassified Leucobacter TaxID=2621730 RepID=UPI00165DBC74|nr:MULTISPECIES: hypothetical protein [unclassified Leucobacter]MBC9954067.1 hypothetical protein [Leucobacter sp. cx-42]